MFNKKEKLIRSLQLELAALQEDFLAAQGRCTVLEKVNDERWQDNARLNAQVEVAQRKAEKTQAEVAADMAGCNITIMRQLQDADAYTIQATVTMWNERTEEEIIATLQWLLAYQVSANKKLCNAPPAINHRKSRY